MQLGGCVPTSRCAAGLGKTGIVQNHINRDCSQDYVILDLHQEQFLGNRSADNLTAASMRVVWRHQSAVCWFLVLAIVLKDPSTVECGDEMVVLGKRKVSGA